MTADDNYLEPLALKFGELFEAKFCREIMLLDFGQVLKKAAPNFQDKVVFRFQKLKFGQQLL